MNAPTTIDISAMARLETNGFGAVIEHNDFDELVAMPGFIDGLLALLAKHLVPADRRAPVRCEIARGDCRTALPSVNKGPRLPGYDFTTIQFRTPASRTRTSRRIRMPLKCCITI